MYRAGIRRFGLALVAIAGLADAAPLVRADDSLGEELAARAIEIASKTPAMPTFGGLQYWNDVRVVGAWRIQRNVLTGHYRLLDGDDHRQAWGTFEECDTKLQKAVDAGDATPARGEVVVVLHGLGSGRWAMHSLTKHLREEGFTVIEFGYSTTSGGVAEHAAALAKVLEGQTGVEKIHFVAHSLGNLVVRHYLADQAETPDERIGRMVMLAPPNQGAAAAKTWARSKAMTRTLGPVLEELGPDWDTLAPKLATPQEFAIIAGGLGNSYGFNVVLDGDDDGTVRLEETQLDGAKENLVVPSLHSLIVYRDDVFLATTNFLRHGSFEKPSAEGKP
jgi:pimeloyl-ACP methyl ester carboxylesterase